MQLKDYIKGNRRGKEANRFEREAMNDPFLQGAIDGFDTVVGDHAKIIEQLEEKYINLHIVPKSKNRVFLYWAAAASVLLLISISTYIFIENNRQSMPMVAEMKSLDKENEIHAEPLAVESEYIEESQQELLIAENKIRKIDPKPTPLVITPIKAEKISNVSTDDKTGMSTKTVSISDLVDHRVIVAERSAKQETQVVRGKIIDEDGNPLAGVSIIEKGTNNGVVTGVDGTFFMPAPKNDSSKLLASYIGYESQEINPLVMNQTVTLKEDNQLLSDVVVIGYGTQKKASTVGASSVSKENNHIQSQFGEKEFQIWCKQKADKNVCTTGKGATVKISFFIDETGKPININFQNYSCDEAKKEIENLLSSSPVWTKTNRKVSITIKW